MQSKPRSPTAAEAGAACWSVTCCGRGAAGATQCLSGPHTCHHLSVSAASCSARTSLSETLACRYSSARAPATHLQSLSLQEQQYELQSLLRLAQSIDEAGASPDSGFRHLVLQQSIPQNLAGYVVQSFRAAPAAPADGGNAQAPPQAEVSSVS